MIAYDRLSQMIPPDMALGNKALNVSLLQITGIQNINLPEFGAAVVGVDNLNDLTIINNQTTAVPPEVANYYINTLGNTNRTPPNLKIVDILGTPSGYVHTNAMNITNEIINSMSTNFLRTVYTTMLHVVTNDLGWTTEVDPGPPPVYETVIPSGYPGAGSYANQDAAVLALIPVAQTEIQNLQAGYSSQCATLNTNWTAMANQIAGELTYQAKANIDWPSLIANDPNAIYGFIFSLPGYGNDLGSEGMKQYIENISNMSTQAGQALAGTVREGTDQTILNSAGIKSNNIIPL